MASRSSCSFLSSFFSHCFFFYLVPLPPFVLMQPRLYAFFPRVSALMKTPTLAFTLTSSSDLHTLNYPSPFLQYFHSSFLSTFSALSSEHLSIFDHSPCTLFSLFLALIIDHLDTIVRQDTNSK